MKKIFVATLFGMLLAASGNTVAQDVDYLGGDSVAAAKARAQPTSVPAGVVLVELERWFYNSDTYSARPITQEGQQHAGQRQGILGFISFTPFAGGHALYSCYTSYGYHERFTSTDPNCEGQLKTSFMPITGYIASTQLPGTVPLYRCMRGGLQPGNWADHFDTTNVNCENVRDPAMDGIIGYIWQ